jgi:putative RecB family exonuclease
MISTAIPGSTNNTDSATDNKKSNQNDVIESMTGRGHLSWSQLYSYRSCPRKWFFSHVEGLEPEFTSAALVFGSAIHSAAQHHYEQSLTGVDTTQPELLEVYHQSWKDEQRDRNIPVRFNKTESQEDLHATAEKMLEAFLSSELAKPEGTLIAIEETLTGQVHPEMPDLVARIDVIWQTEEATHLMDLKTSKSRWSESKVRESADQLLLYQILASRMAPDQELQLHFGVITKAKSPVVQLLDVPQDSSRSEAVINLMLPVWNAMRSGVDYTSPSPMSCTTCPYKSKCPAYRGG